MNSISTIFIVLTGLLCSIQTQASSDEIHPFAVEAGDYVYVRLIGSSPEKKEEYLAKHNKFYQENCGKTQDQPKWILQKCTGINLARRYPKSGMYHKDDPSTPLWTDSKCYGGSYMSSDGEHQVLIGPLARSSDEQFAVRFCRRGEIIAKYLINDLVDDKRKIFRLEFNVIWKSETVFDDKSSTLFIKTLDDNEYTFDIRSGKIINYKVDAPAIYRADILLKNGERTSLDNVKACSALNMVSVLQGKEPPNHVINVVEPVVGASAGTGEILQNISVPFELVKRLRFVKQVKENRLLWEMSTHDGNAEQFLVDTTFAGFCGITSDGKELKLSPKDIAELDLSLSKTTTPPAGHRSVAQRMRWDKKTWENSRKLACNMIPPTNLQTLDDVQDLISQYKRHECPWDANNYVNTLGQVGSWILNQPDVTKVKDFALEIAEMQYEANLYYQSYTLYDYVLMSYDPTIKNAKLSILYEKQRLTEKMLRASEKTPYTGAKLNASNLNKQINAEIRLQNEKKRRQKEQYEINEFLNKIDNVDVESIEPQHEYMGWRRYYLLEEHCKISYESFSVAVLAYQGVVALEEKLHHEGHAHVLKAMISLANCYLKQEKLQEAKKIYQNSLEFYTNTDKKGAISKRESLSFSNKLNRLGGTLFRDKTHLAQSQLMLLPRKLALEMELNHTRHATSTLASLAWSCEILGKLSEAEKYYKQRIQLSQQLKGENNHRLKELSKKALEKFYERIERKKLKITGKRG